MKIVLDAWAILAYLQGEEPAATRVNQVLKEAEGQQAELFMSWINLGEVFYNIGRRRGTEVAEETLEELQQLPITVVSPDSDTVIQAARLKSQYRLSYADAFAVVTAQQLQASLLTGDPEILNLDKIVAVETLRRTSSK